MKQKPAASLLVNGTACVPGQGTREPCDHDMQDRLESEAQHQPQGAQRGFPKPHGREETEAPEEGDQEQAEQKEWGVGGEAQDPGKCMSGSI